MTGFFLIAAGSRPALGPTKLQSNGNPGLLPQGQGGRGVKLNTHLHLVTRLRMSGTISPLPQHVFMEWCFKMLISTFMNFNAHYKELHKRNT